MVCGGGGVGALEVCQLQAFSAPRGHEIPSPTPPQQRYFTPINVSRQIIWSPLTSSLCLSVCLSICLVVKRLGEAFVRLIQFSMSHDQPRPNERTNRGPFFVYVFSKVNHRYVKIHFITSKTMKPSSKKLSLFQVEYINFKNMFCGFPV